MRKQFGILVMGLGLLVAGASPAWAPHNASGCNTVTDGAGSNSVDGTSGCDDIFAGGGNDVVRGFAGADDAHGEDGNDTVYGGGDHDYVFGGPHGDLLAGADGNDHVQDVGGLGDFDDGCGNAGTDFVDVRDGDYNDEYFNGTEASDYDQDGSLSDTNRGSTTCPF